MKLRIYVESPVEDWGKLVGDAAAVRAAPSAKHEHVRRTDSARDGNNRTLTNKVTLPHNL
jgi:hypothetical protein